MEAHGHIEVVSQRSNVGRPALRVRRGLGRELRAAMVLGNVGTSTGRAQDKLVACRGGSFAGRRDRGHLDAMGEDGVM